MAKIAEIDYLLHRLDEARVEIARLIKLNEQLGKVNAGLRQKLTDLEFPPDETDVMEIAEALLPQAPLGLFKSGREEAVMMVARALQQYGDARAREAR